MIFIGLELTGISLYVMTAFNKTDLRSAEAGMKYFLFGSTASAFTSFGISLVYGMTGTTVLATIAQSVAATPIEPLLAVGIVMTLIAFAFKIAVAPFHYGRRTPTRADRFRAQPSLHRDRKSRRSSCSENS